MEWTNKHDISFCREILLVIPFKAKPRTNQRGQLWNEIADCLNSLNEPKFSVTQRSVRDRFKLLSEKFKRKITAEERESGISPEISELDALLEEILDLEKEYREEYVQETCDKKRKEQVDKDNAEEMRLKAMETLKETQKRKADAEGNEKKAKRRSNASEGFKFLREKMEYEKEYRQKELGMREKAIEKEEKKEEREEKRHADLMQMMQMQQQQMQQMQMNFMQAQGQQNQLFMSLIEKLSK